MPKLYDPQIPPKREIDNRIYERASEAARRVTRGPGEVYILTCQCGSIPYMTRDHVHLSDTIRRFYEEVHRDCPPAAAA